MDGKARFIFPIVITAIMVFIVSAVVTFFNGLRADFVTRWLSALAGRDHDRILRTAVRPLMTLRIVGRIERVA